MPEPTSVDAAQPRAERPVTPVGILAAKLERLVSEAGAAGVDPTWTAELQGSWRLAAGLEPYVAACTSPESPALRALSERTRAADDLEGEMLTGHVEGRLLRMLVRVTRARRVLEIGMFTGYSALAMAEALPEGGELVACELDPRVAAMAERAFEASSAGHRIRVRTGPAMDSLRDLAAAGQSFDLVFVDADKPGYAAYLDMLLDAGILADDGLVCVDNTLLQGQPYLGGDLEAAQSANGAAIRAFNQKLVDDPRVEQLLIPVRDGLTLVRRA